LDQTTRTRAQAEIQQMLDWCLSQSLQADGSFKTTEIDDTLGDAQMYGVSFLRDAGYFDVSRRFWTDRAFPDSEAVRLRIRTRLEATGLGDPSLRQAYEDLSG
jgi:hypothetical protein